MAPVQPAPVAVSAAARLWRPVVLVAVAAVVTPAALALLCALLARQPEMGLGDVTALAGALLAGTYGAPTAFSGVMMASGHVGAMPLTLTIATLAVTAWTYRRTTSRLTSAEGLLAGSAAAVLGALAVLGLVAAAGSGQVGGSGRLGSASFGGSAAGAFLGTLVVLLVALGLCAVCRRTWTGRVGAVGDLLRPALKGVAVLLALLPVIGILTGVAGGLTAHHGRHLTFDAAQARAGVAGAVAYVANLGVWSLVLGGGGRVGVSGFESVLSLASRFLDVDVPGPARLGSYAGAELHQPGLWVAVVLTPLALVLSAYAVLRAVRADPAGGPASGRAGGPAAAPLPALGMWAAGQVVVVPLLAHASGARLSLRALFIDAHGGFGPVGWDAALLLTAYALVVGVVAGAVVQRGTPLKVRFPRGVPRGKRAQTGVPR